MRRTGWRTVGGRWARSLGERGVRVRLFQKRKDGVFYRDVWVPGAGKDRKSLRTCDREEAERLGRSLLAALLAQGKVKADGGLLLGELWERYSREATSFLDNAPSTRRDDSARARILLAHFGAACDVRSITLDDLQAYGARRRQGGIRIAMGKRHVRLTKPVGARAIECDAKLLKAMMRWATTVRTRNGAGRLLDAHPLAGVTIEREPNPKRPVATFDRFAKTRTAIGEKRAATTEPNDVARWVRLDLALVLAESTGRRIGSIRQLKWHDIDVAAGVIHWQASNDKMRRESVVPIAPATLEEVKRARQALAELVGLQAVAPGAWVFAAESDPTRPVDRYLLSHWLELAERAAKLPKLRGGLWHPYRRKWATEKKHHPLKDVAAAGGWKDVETLLSCYQAADPETLLAVVTEPRKLRETGTVTGTA